MTVPFNITPSDMRVPFFYAEADASQAGYFSQQLRTLIIAPKITGSSVQSNTPLLLQRTDDVKSQCGRGSVAAIMHAMYRKADTLGEINMLLLDDPAAGVAATGTLTFTGTPTAAGTLSVYIGNDRVQSGVNVGDSVTAVAAAFVAAVTANPDLPVTATNAAGVVTLAFKHKGTIGNGLKLQMNFKGPTNNEVTPAGLNVAVASFAGGTGVPTLTAALAALGDNEYDFIIHPYSDNTSLTALKALMNDTSGRWAYNRQIYGHAYTAAQDTLSNLVTAFKVSSTTNGLNDQHCTVAGYEIGVPNPPYEYAAAYGARNAVFVAANAFRPTQTGELVGITPAPLANRFLQSERSTLLYSGIATSYVGGGVVRIERAITNYQQNAFSQTDPSYLDSETMHQLAYVIRRMRSIITTKYPRHGLANDGTRLSAGAPVVTPKQIRGEFIAEYSLMEYEGKVENATLFAKYLIVERNAQDPSRLDVLFPPDFVNGLRIFALLAQFRLQYPTTA